MLVFFIFLSYLCARFKKIKIMDNKNFLVNYILDWFQTYRPELDMRRNEAENFYKENKFDDLFVSEENRENKAIEIKMWLDRHYLSYANQICMEVSEEKEFFYATFKMKEVGFIYSEEMEAVIIELKKMEWYKDYLDNEELLHNEEFRERVRNFFREREWNNFVPLQENPPLKDLIWQFPPNDENIVRTVLEREGEDPEKIEQLVEYVRKRNAEPDKYI